MGPFKQATFRSLASTFQVAMPAISIQSGIDSHHTHLRTETVGYLFYQMRIAQGGTIDAHLVCTGIQHAFYVSQFIDTTANRKRDIELLGHLGDHLRKGLSSLKTSRDIQKYQFIGTSLAIGLAELYRVSCTSQLYKIYSLDGLTVLHI